MSRQSGYGKSRSAGGVALTYAKGKVCPKCGDPRPDQRAYCTPCQNEYGKAYYWKNREKMAAYMKRYNREQRSRRLADETPSGYDDITDPPIPEYSYTQLGLGLIDCDVVRHGRAPEGISQDLGDIRAAIYEQTGARHIDFDTLHFDNYPNQDEYPWREEDEPEMPIVPKRPPRVWTMRLPKPPQPIHPPYPRVTQSKKQYDTWWNYWEDVTD